MNFFLLELHTLCGVRISHTLTTWNQDLRQGRIVEERTVLKRTLPTAFNTAQPNSECILARALKASFPVLVTLQGANGTPDGNKGYLDTQTHSALW